MSRCECELNNVQRNSITKSSMDGWNWRREEVPVERTGPQEEPTMRVVEDYVMSHFLVLDNTQDAPNTSPRAQQHVELPQNRHQSNP